MLSPSLVLLVVAGEEAHMWGLATAAAAAFVGQDVGANAVQEEAIVADHHCTAREVQQRLLQRPDSVHVQVIRWLKERTVREVGVNKVKGGGERKKRCKKDRSLSPCIIMGVSKYRHLNPYIMYY